MPRPQLTVTNITGFSQSSPPFYIPGPELGTGLLQPALEREVRGPQLSSLSSHPKTAR